MAKKGKLDEIATQHQEPLDVLIPAVIEREKGVKQAAESLGVTPNTLWFWLRVNGYEVVRTVKVGLR